MMADEKMTVVFRNLEQAGARLDFSFGDVPKEKKKKVMTYHLEDGYEYDLPLEVIDHLNGLTVPIYDFRDDPETGRKKSVKVGDRPRFSCVPVRVRQPVESSGDDVEPNRAAV
jgi:hypothetical protein